MIGYLPLWQGNKTIYLYGQEQITKQNYLHTASLLDSNGLRYGISSVLYSTEN